MPTPRRQTAPPSGSPRRPVLVAIAGASGSGKSWLAQALNRELSPQGAVLSLDRFYRDRSHLAPAARDRVNFDSPRAIDWERVEACLKDLHAGRAVEVPIYDFATHTRSARTERLVPREIVLVEGLWPWWRSRLSRFFSLRIYRQAPARVCLERRTSRDVQERGRTAAFARRQWREHTQPMARKYVLPQRRSADLEVGEALSAMELRRLARWLRELARLSPSSSPTSPGHP